MCAPAKTSEGVYGYSNTGGAGTMQVVSYVPGQKDAWGTPTAGLVNVVRSDGSVGVIPMQQVVQNQNAAISASLGTQKGIAVGGNDQKGGMSYNTYANTIQGKYIKDPTYVAAAASSTGQQAAPGGQATQNPTTSTGTTPNQSGGGDVGYSNQGGGVTVVSKQAAAQQGTTSQGQVKKKKTSRQASSGNSTIATGSGGLLGKSATGTKDLLGA